MGKPLDAAFEAEFDDAYRRIPNYALERIRSARVLLLGVGALGNEVAKNLALFDVGYLYLCDMDTVEWANLSHSVLFRRADQGRPKVEAAAEALRGINPRLEVRPFNGPLTEIGIGVWRRMDAIVSGLDNRGSRLLVDRICGKAGKEWIDAGLGSLAADGSAAGLLQAAVQRFSPRDGCCYEYYLQSDAILEMAEQEAAAALRGSSTWEGCTRHAERLSAMQRIPTTPAMASIVGALQAQEVIRQLSPGLWGRTGLGVRRLSIDLSGFATAVYEHPAGVEVPPLEPVTECPELSARHTTVGGIVARAKRDLGPQAIVRLGFEYVMGLGCSVCGRVDERPMKLRSQSIACPHCSTPERPVDRYPVGDVMPDYLDGSEPFLDLPLAALGVPLLDVLTACKRSECRQESPSAAEETHYELTGDLVEALG